MKRTNLLRGNNARAYLNYLKAIGIPFTMTCSNYTVLFKTDFMEKKFVYSMQSNRAFTCFAKLKKDIKNKPVPDIDQNTLSYFVHDFKQDAQIGDIINIDLKSAYATILHMDGYISADTYSYICAGSKQERLVSVGMLASKKQEYKFDSGHIIGDPLEIISPYSNFFFYAVKRTGEIMDELKKLCGESYLFTWVDGIYLKPDIQAMQACEEYIESIGMKYTSEWLRDFSVKINSKFITVNFLKKSGPEWKPKPFNLPIVNTEFKRLMIDAILSRLRKAA